MMLEDLGQGYHLIPVRDHCRLHRRKRLTHREQEVIHDLAMDAYWEGGISAYRLRHDQIKSAWEGADKYAAQHEREQARQNALHLCDPMAVQATRVLRSVFQDILMGEF